MLTPLILFLGLLVATAVIAYWSDNLGKKLGKKRVSLFGLRPRTTATVLTITSSWAIMLFTLVVLLLVVTPLRRALFRYDRDRAQYRRDIGTAKAELAGTRDQLQQTQASYVRTDKQLSTARNSLEQARDEVEAARAAAQKAQNRAATALAGERKALQGVSRALKRVADAQRRVAVVQKRYRTAQEQFAAAQQRFLAAQDRAELARERQELAQRDQQEAEEQFKQARSNLVRTRSKLTQVRSGLALTRTQLRQAQVAKKQAQAAKKEADLGYERAKASFERLAQDIFKLDTQIAQLNRQKTELTQENAQLTQEKDQLIELVRKLDEYQRAAVELVGGSIVIPVNRTFAAGIIEAGKSQNRIEENLRQLLAKGRQVLPSLGISENATLELLPLPEEVGDRIVFLQGDAIFERLAKEIAGSEEATSVRLVAARNFIAGENRIDTRFVAVRVATAIRAGEVLATVEVDGSSGDAPVFNKLQDLTDDGRTVAIGRKVNPPQSPQEQYFYAAGTNVALFAAMRRIQAAGKTVTVRLVAADDLSTVEPLRVRFEIEGEASGGSG
jgi:uncharacterized protein (DUF3084 family)